MPISKDEIMWAVSGTGEDFQCVDLSFAEEQAAEIERLRAALTEAETVLMMVEPQNHKADYLAALATVRTALHPEQTSDVK